MSVGGAHVKVWDGNPGYLYEQGRQLAAGLKLRSPRVDWTANLGVKGTFNLVNDGASVLSVPKIPLPSGRLKVHISVERLARTPIPAIRDVGPDLIDQYRLVLSMSCLFGRSSSPVVRPKATSSFRLPAGRQASTAFISNCQANEQVFSVRQ